MVVKEISEMRIRGDLAKFLPQSLAQGEFGLGIDTGELFLGTPHLSQVQDRISYPYKNTQILTEWTPNIEKLLRYRVRNRDFSKVDPLGNPQDRTIVKKLDGSLFSRNLQEKLDEIITVTDYGATGNGTLDINYINNLSKQELDKETFAIQQAIIDASNNLNFRDIPGQYKPKALYFPAGIYIINKSLPLPPRAFWYGDGMDNSIIIMVDDAESVVETVDGNFTTEVLDNYRMLLDNGVSINEGNNPLKVHGQLNISEESPPENIYVQGIGFKHLHNKDVVRLFRTKNAQFIGCRFESSYQGGSKGHYMWYDACEDSIAVTIDSLGDIFKSEFFVFDGCHFTQSTYGFMLTDDVCGVSISKSRFDCLYKGISIGDDLVSEQPNVITYPVDKVCPPERNEDRELGHMSKRAGLHTFGKVGPAGVRVSYSLFDNIQNEGISIYRCSDLGNGSFSNTYKKVGEGLNPDCTSNESIVSPVITFGVGTKHNVSSGDSFSRTIVPTSEVERRVAWHFDDPNMIINAQDPLVWSYGINMGGGLYQSGMRTVFLDPGGITSKITLPKEFFPLNEHDAYIIEYSLEGKTGVNPIPKRIGTLRFVTDGSSVSWNEDTTVLNSVEDDIQFSFGMSVDGDEVELVYKNNSGITYEFRFATRSWNTNSNTFAKCFTEAK